VAVSRYAVRTRPGTSTYCFSFTAFHKVTVDDVIAAICRLPDKSCVADTLPAPQLNLVADLIAPFLTELLNRSLSTATVPEVFKSALITPLLKQPDLDSADPRSYRPISNLSALSKLLECIVFWQLYSYLSAADLLKVLIDILYAVDDGDLSVLALLDLSAAFDTVDHDILLTRLKVSCSISGAALTGSSPT